VLVLTIECPPISLWGHQTIA